MPRLICAWCDADLGEAVGCSDNSHGICKLCIAKELAKLEGGDNEQGGEAVSMVRGGSNCGGDDCHRAVCGLGDPVAVDEPGSVRVHVAASFPPPSSRSSRELGTSGDWAVTAAYPSAPVARGGGDP